MSLDYAIQSDFLIHWTGRDIDEQLDGDWFKLNHSRNRDPRLINAYLSRLLNTLRYGLWLTEEAPEKLDTAAPIKFIPPTPKMCFTELKLSESRSHARKFGRLGIGVKRPFLIDRLGRPVAYYAYGSFQRSYDPLLTQCAADLGDKTLLNFFKPMNSSQNPLPYDLYAESEWRILYFQQLLKSGLLVDSRDKSNKWENNFYESLSPSEKSQLKYLAPLDGWFSMIIYPSIDVKNAAQQGAAHKEIQDEIRRIKAARDHANTVEGGSWPIEVDLDACRHF
jgi:hypothetical protein